MKNVLILSLLAFLLLGTTNVFGQDIIGLWKSVDDETKEEKSYVKVFEKDGKIFGVVEKILREEHVNDVCTACNDHRKDQPILGMEVISNMSSEGDELTGGKILDPEKGKIYKCKMWIEDGNLMVRGYWGFLYRTQTWYRVE